VLVLQGYGVTIDIVGTTFINNAGITSTTFKAIPDEPVGTFELNLPEGPYSALAANGNLCNATRTITIKRKVTIRAHGRKRTTTRTVHKTERGLVMPTLFVAQNGAVIHKNTPIGVTGCGKHVQKSKRVPRREHKRK